MNNTDIKEYILSHFNCIFKPPAKNLKYPFIVPGTGYLTELWGWDAYWEALALKKAFDMFGNEKMLCAGISEQKAAEHICGCVLNFLDAQEKDGFIPIMVSSGGLFENFFHDEYIKGTPFNQHLPFLCQMALLAFDFCGGFTFDIDKLIKYMRYFETHQYDERWGLFFWRDDIMIGIDNNPTVFYRQPGSGADIFLNSFIYLEYVSLGRILERMDDGRSQDMHYKAERLKTAVNMEMWDERDGIYYSQDIAFYKTEREVKGVKLHAGLAPHWHSMPLKIRFWACFLPMYAKMCSVEQAEKMCRHLTENDDIFARYGIRTLARNEKMYSLAKSEGNPSNWLGSVWGIANYCVYKGLLNYGQTETAEKLQSATVAVLGKNLKEHGDFFESYHPDTGEPFMHPGFLSHNLPIIEML